MAAEVQVSAKFEIEVFPDDLHKSIPDEFKTIGIS
jgi:hypothetical protein